jgi:hypothetical protein
MAEKDPEKLRQLTRRINELLEEKELRLLGEIKLPNGTQVFQIAYDEGLLMTRAELLKGLGYEVTSALSNDDAKRLLKNGKTFAIFIIGHANAKPVREEMVTWLRTNFPGAKIIALNPHSDSRLKGADYNFILNGPEEWLAAVASAAG